MKAIMKLDDLTIIDQLTHFLSGTQAVAFSVTNDKDASHSVELKLAGVLYRSRHKIDEICLALFDVGSVIVEGRQGTLDDYRYLEILEKQSNWGLG
jgi:hypothetical protein